METTGELLLAVVELREAVIVLSEALGEYRQPGASLEGTAFRFDRPDGPADLYLAASAHVAELIGAALEQNAEDADAMTRLIAAVTVDSMVAEQASLLAMMVEPAAPDGTAVIPELSPAEVQDLGEPLAQSALPVLDEIAGGDGQASATSPGVPPATSSTGRTFEWYVEQILERAAEDIIGTAGAAVPFAHQVQSLLAAGGTVAGQSLFDAALKGLKLGWHALRRLAARAWKWVMRKLGVVANDVSQIGKALAHERSDVVSHFINSGAARLLGKMLDSKQVVDDAEDLLRPVSAQRQKRALDACPDVVEHMAERQRYVTRLNKTLPLLSTLHVPGLVIGALGAAILLTYSIWDAHDHIDAPWLSGIRIPGNPGLLQVVRATI
jgi:hypothetical protein